MVSLELYFDHPQFRSLYCPSGTQFGGRFDVSHLNNWQHAASYPAFFLSGVIDITEVMLLWPMIGKERGEKTRRSVGLGYITSSPPPPRVGQAAMALAFSVMSFLMGTHVKHEPLDAMMHWCLFFAMCLVSIACFVELHAPNNPTVSVTKGAATVLLGSWFCVIGRTIYNNNNSSSLPQWSTEYHGGVMFTPVLFSFLVVLVLFLTLLLFVVLLLLQRRFHIVDILLTEYGTAAGGNNDDDDNTKNNNNKTCMMNYSMVDCDRSSAFSEDRAHVVDSEQGGRETSTSSCRSCGSMLVNTIPT